MSKQRVRKAIFPVGGLGVRFLPATKAMPKEMLPVVDKPLIQYAVEEAKAAGIEQFIFVTSRGKSAIEDHFDLSFELQATLTERAKKKELALLEEMRLQPGQVAYVRQQEPLGLGHAVWCARHMIQDEPVAVLLADDLVKAATPCLKQMVEAQAEVGGNIIAVMDVAPSQTDKYGVVKPGATKGRLVEVQGLVEKPAPSAAPSTLAVIGRYILQPELFGFLARHERGAGNEIQLTDAMAKMIGKTPFHGYRFEGTRFDCGDKAGFVEATLAYALEHETVGKATREMLRRLAQNLS
ncbi:MAG TPA: UTP--glucose-1-phosphate uridylyltransferase GalU [Hypericibacter adhaerens]|jgi:UTP--glucose-1-phosphate uridylyltransferase|uniref:UTP--glucose-1-phosphate uridylyltransferase n=1 Tax=Hypericibacter adhaerens TaxID=2602016 RepID=A0A5J6MWG6_9PROT|nr:UTP--glucose-1-phosphate uridylyltransferase GalU [Hypericibacter adhaerens]QEX21457.1 UTP--glucose-1-phosphate uridylyltransferase [Hypericibacter adhaerens]HWA43181.1 UTP--glucose-1-phosphate uridylyltransferase GalU [Hypericibacter adhaerens]